MGRKSKKQKKSWSRRLARRTGFTTLAFLAVWGAVGDWFVHQPRTWQDEVAESWPEILIAPLVAFGSHVADITDGLDLTGTDSVYEYDELAPQNTVAFAGFPKRIGAPAPGDITVHDRGEFAIGWSDTLRHPVWCAYHVRREATHPEGKRPGFTRDKHVAAAPKPDAYTGSNYDRGHMVPNHAIVTRYGESAQKLTFQMSNIAPQSPSLNRGVWRNVEHRIADLWTRRYGEVWVVVGAIPSETSEKLAGSSDIDVPSKYYQVIVSQDGLDIRMLAMVFPQGTDWDDWAVHHLISVRDLEKLTGLDFNPDLPEFIQEPLETQLPTRLWPVRKLDIFRQFLLRYW